MTLSALIADLRQCMAKGGYTPAETSWMVRDIFGALKGYSQVDLITHEDEDVSDYIAGKAIEIAERVASGEPIQHLLGFACFMGLSIKVTPDTLIPRPETEQLVDMAADCAGSRCDLRIKDIGTGSGCIALALGRALHFPAIEATDISDAALAVAAENATALKVKLSLKKEDILTAIPEADSYDIIISNPPYIAEHEKADMERVVTDHEPHTALFVPDADPTLYYRAIARYAACALAQDGHLWLEINPLYAHETRREVADAGFMHIEVIADERGKKRFIHAHR